MNEEQLKQYLKEELHYCDELRGLAFSAFKAGVAAYAYLQSPSGDEWRREHGFITTEQIEPTTTEYV